MDAFKPHLNQKLPSLVEICCKDQSDEMLLVLISQDNRAAFDEIYKRNWQSLYQSAFYVLKEQDECMDVLQEVFIWFWEHRKNLAINSIKGYLHAAVKYKVANCIRNGKVKQAFFTVLESRKIDLDFTETSLEVKELKEIIDRFTQELPERCREVFHLSRNEYLSNKRIAEKLGISQKTVENQITTALKKLRISLGRLSCWMFFFL